jgi:hypothetical protein
VTEAEALCTKCGLCCNGTLFARVPLTPSEVVWASRRRLPVMQKNEAVFARLPCACFGRDGRCDDYDARPAACQEFACALLRRLGTGEASAERADAAVMRAKELVARIEPLVPPGLLEPLFDRAHRRESWDGEAALDLLELMALLSAEFGFELEPATRAVFERAGLLGESSGN